MPRSGYDLTGIKDSTPQRSNPTAAVKAKGHSKTSTSTNNENYKDQQKEKKAVSNNFFCSIT